MGHMTSCRCQSATCEENTVEQVYAFHLIQYLEGLQLLRAAERDGTLADPRAIDAEIARALETARALRGLQPASARP